MGLWSAWCVNKRNAFYQGTSAVVHLPPNVPVNLQFQKTQDVAREFLDEVLLDLDAAEYAKYGKHLATAHFMAVYQFASIPTSDFSTNPRWFRLRYAIEVLLGGHPLPSPDWQPAEVKPGEAECKICGRLTLATKQDMLDHVKEAHVLRPFLTPRCTKSQCDRFGQRFELAEFEQHLSLHYARGWYIDTEYILGVQDIRDDVCYDFRCDLYKTVFSNRRKL